MENLKASLWILLLCEFHLSEISLEDKGFTLCCLVKHPVVNLILVGVVPHIVGSYKGSESQIHFFTSQKETLHVF
jgi:hypothetical protein